MRRRGHRPGTRWRLRFRRPEAEQQRCRGAGEFRDRAGRGQQCSSSSGSAYDELGGFGGRVAAGAGDYWGEDGLQFHRVGEKSTLEVRRF